MGRDVMGQDPATGQLYRSTNDSQVNVVLGTIASNRNGSVQGTAQETTTSTSYVNFSNPSLEVSLTTGGGPVFVFLTIVVQRSNPGGVIIYARLLVDGAPEPGAEVGINPATNGVDATLTMVWMKSGLAPGPHTFRIQWRVSAGTGTAVSNRRQLALTELNVI